MKLRNAIGIIELASVYKGYEVLDAVLDLKSSGTKFVFVTHEIKFVRQFAEYVLFMDDGVVAEQGVVEILDAPKTEALRRFLENEG